MAHDLVGRHLDLSDRVIEDAHKRAHGVQPTSAAWQDDRWNHEWKIDPSIFREAVGYMGPFEIHFTPSQEWAALYAGGFQVFDTIGDAYLATDKALALLGVVKKYDGNFMMGGSRREHAADSLDEIEKYMIGVNQREERASQLRQQASRLLAEADELEGI